MAAGEDSHPSTCRYPATDGQARGPLACWAVHVLIDGERPGAGGSLPAEGDVLVNVGWPTTLPLRSELRAK
jgi:hypothetical protein